MRKNLSDSIFHVVTPLDFDLMEKREWMENNWTLSLWASVIYLLFIFLGSRWMRNRKPFDLQWAATLWNVTLAVFSLSAFCTFLSELLYIFSTGGFYATVCTSGFKIHTDVQFWGWLFVMAKMVELGDTVFVILMKRNLLFLHWYHHLTMLIVSWYGFQFLSSSAGWFGVMNSFVHTLTYSYFSLKSFGFRVSKKIARTITTIQLTQMMMGLLVLTYTHHVKSMGLECHINPKEIYLGFGLGLSYLFLFGKHFYNNYICHESRILTE